MENSNRTGIKEIARLAGVSIGTVDRVLHNRSGVSESTRKKVLDIIEQTGYQKNILASRLKLAGNKKIKIAVLIPGIKNGSSYWNLPKKGIKKAVDELKEQGISVSLYYFESLQPQSFREQSRHIFTRSYDAMVTIPFFEEECNELLVTAEKKEMPIVFLDTQQALKRQANFINQDSFNAGRVAGRLLHGLVGNEGMYFVVNIANERGIQVNNLQRANGFKAFFHNKLGEVPPVINTINHPLEGKVDLEENIQQLLRSAQPKGIFITNARSYLIIEMLKRYDTQHVHVLGFDLNSKNLAYLHSGEIQFLIHQKPEFQGYAAIKGLYKYLTSKDSSELNRKIPVDIVVKENAIFYQDGLISP